ncbi:HD-GYP domain-containing protein [Desulfobacula phenolica]|uniref:HD-GYP domain, c-di-GMP phosphodiesterase class II (Or its inactivated variant) n=1 Tax=Desulfobacula phenolica TaxID=90732 RepID=A0A1H2FNV9_9BACT|nr:HD domain-containing phosphohydrolase [Desulfobacula phenolica]SDU09009.1 HD-GYP domain, c-di-GMP phosphodiesterase class II (or its inactivated variant) [Desulfobacula phenolica]
MDLQIEYFNDGTAFHEIDPLSINPENLIDFSIYEKQSCGTQGFRFRCLLVDSYSIPRQRLMELLRFWKKVYIHKKQLKIYNEYLNNNLAYFLKHDEIDIAKKTETLIDLSTDVVKECFKTNFTITKDFKKSIDNVQRLLSQAIEFISDINSLNGIADLIGHDYETHLHSIKVGWLMATFINANRELFGVQRGPELKELLLQAAVAGFLHDIGKIKIPQNVLSKKGKLDNLEYIIIQCHTAYSASLLFDTGLSKFSMQAILYHHENEDGSGYPSGLGCDNIPLIAKVCHIVDVFDALTSKRHYKESKTPFEALKIMIGENPYLDTLKKFEKEAVENKKTPLTAIVRDDYDIKLRRLREKEIIEEEAKKRVEVRMKLRDKGMSHCFNKELLKRFIHTINQSESFELSGVL